MRSSELRSSFLYLPLPGVMGKHSHTEEMVPLRFHSGAGWGGLSRSVLSRQGRLPQSGWPPMAPVSTNLCDCGQRGRSPAGLDSSTQRWGYKAWTYEGLKGSHRGSALASGTLHNLKTALQTTGSLLAPPSPATPGAMEKGQHWAESRQTAQRWPLLHHDSNSVLFQETDGPGGSPPES